MRIAVVHDWFPDLEQEVTWRDGLCAAIKVLSERHQVRFFTCGQTEFVLPHSYFPIHFVLSGDSMVKNVSEYKPDVILHWADFTRPNAKPLRNLGVPMAICFAGGEPVTYNTYDFNHVFVESQVYKDALEEAGCSVSIAFGTNTDLFSPISEQPKQYDALMVGTFAAWKRHDLFAAAVQGLRSLACGYIYTDHEQECWQECLRLGTTVLPHVSAEVLRYLYAASRVCVIPSLSSGGSQRTVLEAMAMNIPVIVTDSDKFDFEHLYRVDPDTNQLRGAINALLDDDTYLETNTRDYVLENYSHIRYADKLEAGLKALL